MKITQAKEFNALVEVRGAAAKALSLIEKGGHLCLDVRLRQWGNGEDQLALGEEQAADLAVLIRQWKAATDQNLRTIGVEIDDDPLTQEAKT